MSYFCFFELKAGSVHASETCWLADLLLACPGRQLAASSCLCLSVKTRRALFCPSRGSLAPVRLLTSFLWRISHGLSLGENGGPKQVEVKEAMWQYYSLFSHQSPPWFLNLLPLLLYHFDSPAKSEQNTHPYPVDFSTS